MNHKTSMTKSSSTRRISSASGSGLLEHPRYYARQLMTPDILTLEHDYLRDKMRRHNRLLHGWGVVCGAWVSRVPAETPAGADCNGDTAKTREKDPAPEQLDPWRVSVSTGYLLSPCGDEIVIDCAQVVDVRTFCSTPPSGDLCSPGPDPWCNETFVARPDSPVFVAVRYYEEATRPVRAQSLGCGCDENACELSRWRDGYQICMLPECPTSHSGDPRPQPCHADLLCDCPACPDDPWVVLARIEISANGILAVDNYSCRRMVISFANSWCSPSQFEPGEEKVSRISLDELRQEMVRRTDLQESDLTRREDILAARSASAVRLRAVTPGGRLGRKLENEDLTIQDVGSMPEETFIKLVSRGVPKADLESYQDQARKVWSFAADVVRLTNMQ